MRAWRISLLAACRLRTRYNQYNDFPNSPQGLFIFGYLLEKADDNAGRGFHTAISGRQNTHQKLLWNLNSHVFGRFFTR